MGIVHLRRGVRRPCSEGGPKRHKHGIYIRMVITTTWLRLVPIILMVMLSAGEYFHESQFIQEHEGVHMHCSVSFFFSINPSGVRNAAISCIPIAPSRLQSGSRLEPVANQLFPILGKRDVNAYDENDMFYQRILNMAGFGGHFAPSTSTDSSMPGTSGSFDSSFFGSSFGSSFQSSSGS